jgi:hypothetical protein
VEISNDNPTTTSHISADAIKTTNFVGRDQYIQQQKIDRTEGWSKAELNAYQRDFFLQEMVALHEEINTRMSQRGNYFTFTIITAGSLLSLGATTYPQIALFYPVLSLFLAAAWSDEDGKIGALGTYLHGREVEYRLAGWSTYHRATRSKKKRSFFNSLDRYVPKSLLSVATRGVFLSTQVMAILVAVGQFVTAKTSPDWYYIGPLIGVAVLAMFFTILVIRHERHHHLTQEKE